MKRPLLLTVLFATLPVLPLAGAATLSPSPVTTIEVAGACESSNLPLITWHPADIECPVCKTKNVFLQVTSYGNYIYQYPSKYQLVFWPFTDSPSWYSCKKCRYTAFMGSFEKPPVEKLDELRKMLAGVTLPPQRVVADKESRDTPPYLSLPVSARMLVAEKVSRTLGTTDDSYWNHFYRVLGYHLEAESKPAEADEARRKSLDITEKLLADKKNDGVRKELLYLAGAMKHFLRDDAAATKLFGEAGGLSYSNPELGAEQNKSYDGYLSEVIKEYLEMLGKGEGPAKMKSKSEH